MIINYEIHEVVNVVRMLISDSVLRLYNKMQTDAENSQNYRHHGRIKIDFYRVYKSFVDMRD